MNRWTVIAAMAAVSCGVAPSRQDAGTGGTGGGLAGAGGGSVGSTAGGSAFTGKRAFVTRGTWTGDLKGSAASGLAGADAKCAAAAQAAGLLGTFKAYVSSDTEDAVARMADVAPWSNKKADGTEGVVVATKAVLTMAGASVTFWTDETGAVVPTPFETWTGNLPTGARDPGSTCRNWESAAAADQGETGAGTGQGWQHDGTQPCNTARRLYCFQQ